jgi:hypothetical protein
MARGPRLKVFRMAVGFHDAYVAAPSQKAAAEAWGADTSVFARREAELVTDPELMEEPLARPGEVVKRLRGTAAEQIAALGETETKAPKRAAKAEARPAPKPKPRPSRGKVDEAEQALAEAKERQRDELDELKEREAALARERESLERRQREERERLEALLEKADASYREALQRWRES